MKSIGKLAVDKDAAKRFITAAISGRTFPPNAGASQDGPSSGSAPTGLEAHLKKTQKQIDRERLLEEEDSSSEDEDLAIIEEPEQASPPTTTSTTTTKRSRAAMDPFAGATKCHSVDAACRTNSLHSRLRSSN